MNTGGDVLRISGRNIRSLSRWNALVFVAKWALGRCWHEKGTCDRHGTLRRISLWRCAHDDSFLDNALDMGTGFDCFSLLSHPDNAAVGVQQCANRSPLGGII